MHCTSCSLGLLDVLIASLCFGSGQLLLQLLHIDVLLLLLMLRQLRDIWNQGARELLCGCTFSASYGS
jgi:hypothetical protein